MTGAVTEPNLFGASCGVYVRIVRLALAEKGVLYRLIGRGAHATDDAGDPSHHSLARPPAFEHDGFLLHDTGAITRYIDEGFTGPSLQPSSARGRARMHE